MRAERGVTLAEMLAVLVGALCMAALVTPVLMQAEDVSDRSVCAAHLARLGEGLRLYAWERGGFLPDCGAASPLGGEVPDDGIHFPSRFDAPGTAAWPHVRAVGNQANLWLLVREGYAEAGLLVCPATADRPSLNRPDDPGAMGLLAMDPVTARLRPEEDRFLSRVAAGRCSYSYQNQFAHPGTDPAVAPPENATTHWRTHPPDLAVLADRNPYTRVQLTRQPVLSPDAAPAANSLNHHGAGQNVLYLSGRVEWHETPLAGPRREAGRRDDIYRPDDGRPDDPLNVPRAVRDSYLVP
jgi:hypothetical protein